MDTPTDYRFITNSLTVRNTPSLKRRETFTVECEVERVLLPDVIGLEAYPAETHFEVVIRPIQEQSVEGL